jgi:hypothetical protein
MPKVGRVVCTAGEKTVRATTFCLEMFPLGDILMEISDMCLACSQVTQRDSYRAHRQPCQRTD